MRSCKSLCTFFTTAHVITPTTNTFTSFLGYRPRRKRRFRDEKKSPGSIFRKGLIQGSRIRKLDAALGWPSQGLSASSARSLGTIRASIWMTASFPLGPNQGCWGGGRVSSWLLYSPGSDGLLKMSLNHSLDLEASLRSLETWEDARTPE